MYNNISEIECNKQYYHYKNRLHELNKEALPSKKDIGEMEDIEQAISDWKLGLELDSLQKETDYLLPLIDIYNYGDPMDGDQVDELVEHIRNLINMNQGNITADEFDELEEELYGQK